MSYLKKLQNKSRYTQAIKAHYETVALDESLSKGLMVKLEKLDDKKQQQDLLNKFVVDEGITGDDLLDLMYDLNKGGFSALQKPTVQGTPKPKSQHSNPMIAKIEKGEIDKELGQMLQDAEDGKTKNYYDVVSYFKSHPDKYGKFINDAAKNAIGFYESNIGKDIPLSKKVLEHVTDDYLIESILYSSIYYSKDVTEDGIEYAFNRFKNPVKTLMDNGSSGDVFPMAVQHFKNKSGWKQKLKTWFNGLTPAEQKDIEDNHWYEDDYGLLSDYK